MAKAFARDDDATTADAERHRSRRPPVLSNRAVSRRLGAGEPLPGELADNVTRSLGVDASEIRVHPHRGGSGVLPPAATARTAETDVVVRPSAPPPTSRSELIAHEAIHVAQQASQGAVASPGALEAEAERYAGAVRRGEPIPEVSASAGAPQFFLNAFMTDRELIDQALDENDSDAATDVNDYTKASETERIDLIRLIHLNDWVGPDDEYALERIWNSFGSQVGEMAAKYPATWDDSLRYGAELWDLSSVRNIRLDFEQDMLTTAFRYLRENLAMVDGELSALGVSSGGFQGETDQWAVEAYTASMQSIAADLQRAVAAREALQNIQVGYFPAWNENHGMPDLDAGGTDGGLDGGVPLDYDPYKDPAYFDPNERPTMGPDGDESPPLATWDQVMEQWQQAQAVVAGIAARSPAAYAAMESGSLDEMVDATPAQAMALASQSLRTLRANIVKTQGMLETGDLEWQELLPIYQQLTSGQVSGAHDWSSTFFKGIADDVIADYQSREFWITLGLSSLAAAAFVVATIATGGLAAVLTGVGIGIGVGMAASSWENWDDLRTAAASTASPNTELVASGQVDAALITAVLDTIFAFVDIFGVVRGASPAIRAARAARAAGLETVSTTALRAVDSMPAAEAAKAIERSIINNGIGETVALSGKSPQQLRRIVTDDAVVTRLDEYMAAVGDGGLLSIRARRMGIFERMRSLGRSGAADVAQAEAIVREALDELGPVRTLQMAGGWKALSEVLGNGSAAGERLMAWRRQTWEDLRRFIGEVPPGAEPLVERTGSQGAFKNDLDLSFFGPDAAANRERGMQFLRGRLGVGADEAMRLLHADLFTDPRRMHLFDALPDGLRQQVATEVAGHQERFIYARRLHDAADDVEKSLIREEMAELGIEEVPWVPLSEGEIGELATLLDGLHAEFKVAQEAGDTAEMARLAGRIAQDQAQIEVARGGGYFSSGGVRRFVTEGAIEGGAALGGLPRALTVGKVGAMLDQLPKLDEAARGLLKSVDADEVGKAFRAIGKYGERMAEVAEEIAPRPFPAAGQFDELAEEFAALKELADRGMVPTLVRDGSEQLLTELTRDATRNLDDLMEASRAVIVGLRREVGLDAIEGSTRLLQVMTRAHIWYSGAKRAVLQGITSRLRPLVHAMTVVDPEDAESNLPR